MSDPLKRFDFSIADYRTLLEEFRALGYRSVGFAEVDPSARDLLLRHDLDLCLERALPIARCEAEAGMTATYYVLVSTEAYNPASARSRRVFDELRDLGHHIGLHFDATAYPGEDHQLEDRAAAECALLELIAGSPVGSISFHRPSALLRAWEGKFAGRPHAYQPRYATEIGYVSDSSGGFFHGHPLDHEAVVQGRAIQLLTHPIWWHSAEQRSADEQLGHWLEERRASGEAVAAAATARAKSRAAES